MQAWCDVCQSLFHVLCQARRKKEEREDERGDERHLHVLFDAEDEVDGPLVIRAKVSLDNLETSLRFEGTKPTERL